MKYKAPGKCPVWGENLSITRLCCPKCTTTIEGDFHPCEFCLLPEDDLNFVKVFIKCRGNIKDVEKELGISYPTVRGKLDVVIRGLDFEVAAKEATEKIRVYYHDLKTPGIYKFSLMRESILLILIFAYFFLIFIIPPNKKIEANINGKIIA